ncbi:hypothetical protein ACFQFR_17320 [Streptomyces goshikiensis]
MTEQNTTGTPTEPTPPAPEAPAPAAPAPKDRRRLFAALRWTAAVVVFAAVGAACAYGIVRSDRTDVPGLSTRSDGRWDYPALVRPTPPPARPCPSPRTTRTASTTPASPSCSCRPRGAPRRTRS